MLDRIAIVVMLAAALLLAWVIPAPFFLWTMAGSVLLLVRSRMTGRKELALCALVMPVFVILRAPLMGIILWLTPHTVDASLLPWDFGLGTRFYAWLLFHPVSREVLAVSYYDALPFWISAAMAFSTEAVQMLKACVLAALLAVPFYLLCPAVGPVWIHTLNAPRNCMPSLHFTWAILAWWYSPRWLRIPSFVLVVLVGLATIGLGEHYLVDLVAAIFFTFGVCWAVGKSVASGQWSVVRMVRKAEAA